jgi:hypothetical protein
MCFPATEALLNQESGRVWLESTPSSSVSKVNFNMNSIFEQATALDVAAFSPFPSISWSFDSEVSDSENETKQRKTKTAPKGHKKFDDLFKCHRRTMRAKHGMVRSKALTGLSHLAGSTSSSMHRMNSFVRLTASS